MACSGFMGLLQEQPQMKPCLECGAPIWMLVDMKPVCANCKQELDTYRPLS